jgi:hypothetical protein
MSAILDKTYYLDRIAKARAELLDFFDTLDEYEPEDQVDILKLKIVDKVLVELKEMFEKDPIQERE